MSIAKRSHDCDEHYELRNYEKLFSCDGCKMKGRGQRYQCKLCGHELHRECRFHKTTISHEYFAGSIFTFRDEPFTQPGKYDRREYSKYCDACGKDICGFSYHCKEDNLDLHPCCRNLEKNLVINNDTVFVLQAKVSSKCIWCKKRKIAGGRKHVPGWSYVSTCNKYHFHVYCMTEMVHEACIKNGEMALEKVELRELAKSSVNGQTNNIFQIVKSLLKIILAALLGDPTLLISNVFVELVSRGLQ